MSNARSVNTIPTESIRISSAVNNAGPGDQRHAQRHNTEFITAAAVARAKANELAHREAKQNQSARDLKVRNRDSKRSKNNLAEKNKTDRHAQPGEDPEHGLMFSILGRSTRPQSREDRDQPDRVDRDKKRDKREQEFIEILLHAHAFRMARALS